MPERNIESLKDTQQQFPNGIDQIKEILLGEEIKSWDERLSELATRLHDLTKLTEKRLSQLEAKITATQEQATLEKQQTTTELDKTRSTLQTLLDDFKNELESQIANLAESKVDRDSIGEVFIQWGQKVKAKDS